MKHHKFSKRSNGNLAKVHPHLNLVAMLALHISPVDFLVYHGKRTLAEQTAFFKAGKSWTMKSAHLTGYAIDCAPWVNGGIDWDDPALFVDVAEAFLEAAELLGVSLRWGGDWDRDGDHEDERHFDGPHFELDRPAYDWAHNLPKLAIDDPVQQRFDAIISGDSSEVEPETVTPAIAPACRPQKVRFRR